MRRAVRIGGVLIAFAALTIVTQIGGVALLIAQGFRQRLVAFVVAYGVLVFAATFVAPVFGRVAVGCGGDGALVVRSWVYCLTNRNYVSPQAKTVLEDLAAGMARRFPGTKTVVLDANFPFYDGFPLLPHLSHDDGRKVDLAFYYRDASGYHPGATRSPIGYFAFDDGPTNCKPRWPSLRWELKLLQPLWKPLNLDAPRMRHALRLLANDRRVEKLFIEPHLKTKLGLTHSKIRFQGCRAARHDDHLHLQTVN